jgi:hypothetical protein
MNILLCEVSLLPSCTLQPIDLCCLDQNSRIYVHEDGDWAVKGRFDKALNHEDPVQWEVGDVMSGFMLRILAVRLYAGVRFLSHVTCLG